MATWIDGYWWSNDGLRLHYRDYQGRDYQGRDYQGRDYRGDASRPPILCIPGLTRNARDFAGVADRLAGDWRVICVDLRGRGESAYAKDPMSYVPLVYLQDIEALLTELAVPRVVLFGTSLGGLLSALIASTGAARVAGALINDVGPELSPAGLVRIRGYVGRSGSFPTWMHAARALAEVHGTAHPNATVEDWLAMARRLCRLTPAGRVVHDYDMKLAEPLRVPGGESGFDMWPAFESLGRRPVTLLRGDRSDLLTPECAGAMARRIPGLEAVTVPGVGHAPILDEPESVAAIDRLLARVLAEG